MSEVGAPGGCEAVQDGRLAGPDGEGREALVRRQQPVALLQGQHLGVALESGQPVRDVLVHGREQRQLAASTDCRVRSARRRGRSSVEAGEMSGTTDPLDRRCR
jgi:hypothetical protein